MKREAAVFLLVVLYTQYCAASGNDHGKIGEEGFI